MVVWKIEDEEERGIGDRVTGWKGFNQTCPIRDGTSYSIRSNILPSLMCLYKRCSGIGLIGKKCL